MTRICHIITGLAAHGAEHMLQKLVTGMDQSQFECSVISLMDKGQVGEAIERAGIPVLSVNLPRGRPTPSGLIRLEQRVRETQPDVLQGWMYHGNVAATLAAGLSFRHIPVVWNIRQSLYDIRHEKPQTRAVIRLSALLSKNPRKIIYNTLTGAAQHENLGFSRKSRFFIPNGFDINVFKPDSEHRKTARRQLGLAEDGLVIGMAARLHPMKDHANFLKAAALLKEQYADARFVLIGSGVTAENTILNELIQKLGLTDRVHLLGEIHDTPSFFQSLDIAVLSSAWGEGFPNVLGEAMACGIPCVATDVGDSANVLGEAGFIVPPQDESALATALGQLIEMGSSGREQLGHKGRERVVNLYSIEAVVHQYESLYQSIAV